MNKSKIFGLIGAAIIIFILSLCLPKCSHDPEVIVPTKDQLKETIREQKQDKDSAHQEVVKWDSIRKPWIHNYKKFKVKKDSIPCPEALAELIILTDTIIEVDSALISSLKAELFIDSLIIANQDSVIVRDSVTIAKNNKKIRQLKRQRNAAMIFGGIGVLFGIVK